jgi:hypothetical protein
MLRAVLAYFGLRLTSASHPVTADTSEIQTWTEPLASRFSYFAHWIR